MPFTEKPRNRIFIEIDFPLRLKVSRKVYSFSLLPFFLSFPRGQEKLPRSSSIDSMVDMVWNNDCETNLVTLPKHLMVQETSSRRESLLSPRRTKQSRGINCKSFDNAPRKFEKRINCPYCDGKRANVRALILLT